MGNGIWHQLDPRVRIHSYAAALGKSRGLADPSFTALWYRHIKREWDEHQDRENIDESIEAGLANLQESQLRTCYAFQAGRSYMQNYPAVATGPFLRKLFLNLIDAAYSPWEKANAIVCKNEDLLQSTLMDMANEAKQLQLKRCLMRAWARTIGEYNRQVERVAKRTSDRKLFTNEPLPTIAPNISMPESPSPDLLAFEIAFLRDKTVTTEYDWSTSEHVHVVPLYRDEANYNNTADCPDHLDKVPEEEKNGRIKSNVDVANYLTTVRAAYLVPHINLSNLSSLPNLLNFIHYRARINPRHWASRDNELTYIGRQSRILNGPMVPGLMFGYEWTFDKESGEKEWGGTDYGWGHRPCQFTPDSDGEKWAQRHITYFDQGLVFGGTEMYLILLSQIFTNNFLNFFLQGLQEIRPECKDLTTEKTQLEVYQNSRRYLDLLEPPPGEERWTDIAAAKQYKPVFPTFNTEQFYVRFDEKSMRAKDHLHRLFHDPNYFCEKVIEQKNHHWANLVRKYTNDRTIFVEDYHSVKRRHELYTDCIRDILRRAVYEVYIWQSAIEHLANFYYVFEKRMPDLFPDPNDPEPGDPFGSQPDWGDGPNTLAWPLEYPVNGNRMPWARDRSPTTFPVTRLSAYIRHYAAFFVNEFRTKAIHAGSAPLRDEFVKDDGDPTGKKSELIKGHYMADPMVLDWSKSGFLDTPETNTLQRISEYIDNFIADTTGSMHVGMRKVTQALQMDIVNPDGDLGARACITDLVADTIDSLDLLAELVEELEVRWPMKDVMAAQKEAEMGYVKLRNPAPGVNGIRVNLGWTSITTHKNEPREVLDFLAFDNFDFEVPLQTKRLSRIFTFLDEMQEFNDNMRTEGYARGDLKRLGASLLRDFVVKRNQEAPNPASETAIKILEDVMQVRKEQYPFDPRENPIFIDQDSVEHPTPSQELQGFTLSKEWRGERKRVREERDERKATKKRNSKYKHRAGPETDAQYHTIDDSFALIQKRRVAKAKSRSQFQLRREQEDHKFTAEGVVTQDEVDPDDLEVNKMAIDDQPTQAGPSTTQQPVPSVAAAAQQRAARRRSPPHIMAPDGVRRTVLPKRVWDTLSVVYGIHPGRVNWSDMRRAMTAIGYKELYNGGSHMMFRRTKACRWPEAAVSGLKGENLSIARNHGGDHGTVPSGKVRFWTYYLNQRGLTWDFIRKWYRKQDQG